jgi:hypothetical protein
MYVYMCFLLEIERRIIRKIGRDGCGGIDGFRKFCSQREIGLEHSIVSHLIREPLGTSDLKEGAAEAVGEEQRREFRNGRASQPDTLG